MSLVRLKIQNIRNIVDVELIFDPRLNLVCGPNGSGKTSLLESILFLEKGRPHRGSRFAPLVREGSRVCTVFGLIKNRHRKTRLGISREIGGKREIRINGEVEIQTSLLAEEIPVLYLGPETIDLLLGSPTLRRRFLNWGVFHVEPQFKVLWLQANRSLKQRNKLLRTSVSKTDELATWTKLLSEQAEAIHLLRLDYFGELEKTFFDILEQISEIEGIGTAYFRGWRAGENLLSVYESKLDSDLRRGFTHEGFQRADFKVTKYGEQADQVCSRGELKVITWAMMLAQGKLLTVDQQDKVIYLVDDIGSELDEKHRNRICGWLVDSESQVIATGIESLSLRENWRNVKGREFHVEHGVFTNQENIG
jgi:DNA replication and repair protein RecF